MNFQILTNILKKKKKNWFNDLVFQFKFMLLIINFLLAIS